MHALFPVEIFAQHLEPVVGIFISASLNVIEKLQCGEMKSHLRLWRWLPLFFIGGCGLT